MKIRVADFIAEFLVKNGIHTLFTITGGGAMHLNDAFGKNPHIDCIYNHNEQACGMAAEGYSRISGKTGAVCVTTGPGGTNAISGVMGAWLDSVPMIVISGQVKYETTVRSTGLDLRQMGDQEFDIVKCVNSLTKYAVMVTEPEDIRYHLQKAYYLATSGRPGPCWLDIPMNVQAATVETNGLSCFNPQELEGPAAMIGISAEKEYLSDIRCTASEVLARIRESKRPVIYAGNGIHISKAEKAFIKMAETLRIPVVAGFNAHDIMPYEHGLYIGRPGTIGDRAGNFAVQNSDLLLVIGCRLGIRQTGYNWDSFARAAYKIMVDIDVYEMEKPNIRIDRKVVADASVFINVVNDIVNHEINDDVMKKNRDEKKVNGIGNENSSHRDWLKWCLERKEKYPVVLKSYRDGVKNINPYCFMEELGQNLSRDDIIVAANATACICSFQALRIKAGQRIFSNSGSASMGYDLPAAIGAYMGKEETGKKGSVICLAGDGSIQMNIQELQTIVNYKIPLKIFVLNNNGYHSIRQTQRNFFGEPLVGCEPSSGVSFPDIIKLAKAYGIPCSRAESHSDMGDKIVTALKAEGPFLCEVVLTEEQPFAPKPSSVRLKDGTMVSQPLENMAPFLSREEFLSNMIIEPIE